MRSATDSTRVKVYKESGLSDTTIVRDTNPEDNPIGQPLHVILVTGRLDGLDRKASGKNESNQVRDRVSEGVDEEGNQHQDSSTNCTISFGDLRLLLEDICGAILGELRINVTHSCIIPSTAGTAHLFIQLTEIVTSLVLSLLNSRMSLDGGHLSHATCAKRRIVKMKRKHVRDQASKHET